MNMQLLLKKKPVLFISDLHLQMDRPDITQAFLSILTKLTELPEINKPSALYILGDLFELWCGDDENTFLHQKVAEALAALNASNIPCYFQHGNRDFVLGKGYAKRANLILLAENHVETFFGQKTLLTHGDLLCTKDLQYLRMRKYLRHPLVLKSLCLLPLGLRQKMVARIRQSSIESSKRTQQQIEQNPNLANQILEKYDVDEAAVITFFQHFGVEQMIHGHTHKPNEHQYEIDQTIHTRWVLDDWDVYAGILYLDESGFSRQQFLVKDFASNI